MIQKEIKEISCIDCINHNLSSEECLHSIHEKILDDGIRTIGLRDLWEITMVINHNNFCFNKCTHKNKPKTLI
jgi:hypothetical protein